jgi:hypothetical protein
MTAPRRRWSFSLRALFVAVTVLAIYTSLIRGTIDDLAAPTVILMGLAMFAAIALG